MNTAHLWKSVAERIAQGERDEAALSQEVTQTILASRSMTVQTVAQLVLKRIRDLISAAVKPTGITSRVPAGQESFGWVDMEPLAAITALQRQVKAAYAAMRRAKVHAEILGILEASGLDAEDYETFGTMLSAANVPDELVRALAA